MDSSAVVTPPYVAGPLRLEPFRALMLAPARIGDPASARAFARPYRTVAQRLTRLQSRGQLTHDDEPAVYLHEYTANGITVRGLVGALDISRRAHDPADRAVLPHEGIHPAQADDLADRMAEMGLNPAPILLVHRAPAVARALVHRLLLGAPDHAFGDHAGQQHRIWAIRAEDDLRVLAQSLAGSRALIADGHHRYAAYLRVQQRVPGPATDHGLAMLVDHDDTPLFLGAIHRLLVGVGLSDVATAARTVGARYRATSRAAALGALGPGTLVLTDGAAWARLDLEVPDGRATVEVLHDEFVPALPRGPSRIGYHHSAEEAMASATPDAAVAVLLPAPDVDLVMRIVDADRLLPEKATSFQPKPSLGVLIRSLRDG